MNKVDNNHAYIGVSCGHHDSTITVIKGGVVVWSGGRGLSNIDGELIREARGWVDGSYSLHYYERPWLKNLRCLWSGEGWRWDRNRVVDIIGADNMRLLNPAGVVVHTYNHHLSHCGGAFQTSGFEEAVGVVIDAIGEWDTATIWRCEWIDGVAKYRLVWRQWYPRSIGLFYSAMTVRCGFRALGGEGELMRLSERGEAKWVDELRQIMGLNLHRGVGDILPDAAVEDLAASTQAVAEESIMRIMTRARAISGNLVYGGGVAFNSLANRRVEGLFDSVYRLRNPGDGGSSLGCAALGYGGRVYIPQTTK
jgi:carbamoyltransferase